MAFRACLLKDFAWLTIFRATVRRCGGALFVLLLLTAWLGAAAQTASNGTLTVGSGVSLVSAVAVDGRGNVFVADYGHHAVKEIEATNGVVTSTSTVKIVGSGFSVPAGVAVDGCGNVFVADFGNDAVYEIEATNGVVTSTSTVKIVGSGFSSLYGVAVDSSGNVFVADSDSNAVYEIEAANGVVTSASTVKTVGSGFYLPRGVAVDSSGNVFVADFGNAMVKEIKATNGEVTSTSTVKTVGSGFSSPFGIAVDGSGNVFVADFGDSLVKEIEATNGEVTSTSTVKIVGSGFSNPKGVAVDGNGNVFVADTNNFAVKEIVLGTMTFGTVNVGSRSATLLIPFAFTSSGTPSGWNVLTQGASGKDFTEATAGTTCSTTASYVYGDSCVVAVQFKPLHPGLRMGVVQLLDSGGNVIASTHLKGIGSGPQIVFPSNDTPSAVGSGFNHPFHLAVDASGNVFVADTFNNEVKEIVAMNGVVTATSTVKTVGSGFRYPMGVAVDGSGNVFVADTFNNEVKEIVATNGVVTSTSTVKIVGSGFDSPIAAAVDGSGNIFVADCDNNAVKEIVATNGVVTAASTVKIVGGGFNLPYGVAVDGSGNVFVTDPLNNAVKEIVATNGVVTSTSTVKVVGSGFGDPVGVAVGGSGNVFVADDNDNSVKEIVATNGVVTSASTVKTVGSRFGSPSGVAVDASGSVFVAEFLKGFVEEMPLATAPAKSFATTTEVGTTDGADGSFTVTVANNGNRTLTFPLLSSGNNPSVSTDFGWNNASTCTQVSSSGSAATLAPGESCTLVVNFAPTTGGSISGGVTLTDDSLNASYATQTIALSGLSIAATRVISSKALTVNQPASFTPITGCGGAGTLSYGISPSLPNGLSFSTSTGQITGTPTTTSAATTYSVTVTDTNSATTTNTFSLTVNSTVTATQSVASTTLTQNHAVTAFTPITGSGGTDPLRYGVSPSLPSGLSFSTSTGQITGTPTATSAVTTYSVTVIDANSAAANAAFSLSVVQPVPSISISNIPLGAVYGGSFTPTISYTGDGTTSVTSSTTDACMVAGGAVKYVGAGTCTLVASATAGTNYSSATGSPQSFIIAKQSTTTALEVTQGTLTGSGMDVTLTATVTPVTGGVPTGTVSFNDNSGATALCTAALSGLSANDMASCTTTLASNSTNVLSASYGGDTHYSYSSSASSSMVSVGSLQFTLTANVADTISVVPGSATQYSFKVSPVSPATTFSRAITYWVRGLPDGSTITFSPVGITAGSGPTTVTMTIQTSAMARSSDPDVGRRLSPLALALLVPFLGLGAMRRQRKVLGRWLSVLLVLGGLVYSVTLSGCGGGYFTHAQENHDVTVTAASGNVQKSFDFQLNVQ